MSKFTVLLTACMAFFFFACSKNDQQAQLDGSSLEGTWELRVVLGGMVPANPGTILPGNGDLWKFSAAEYARVYKDSIHQSGKYYVSKGTGTDPNTGRRVDQFMFDQLPAESFELARDTLRLYYGAIAADGVILQYVKISNSPGL